MRSPTPLGPSENCDARWTARVGDGVTHYRARAALSHPAFRGLDRAHLGALVEELADPWLGAVCVRVARASRRSAQAGRRGRATSWSSPTGSWSPWFTCAFSCPTRHWPSSAASPAPRSPAPTTRPTAAHPGWRLRLRLGRRRRTVHRRLVEARAEFAYCILRVRAHERLAAQADDGLFHPRATGCGAACSSRSPVRPPCRMSLPNQG